MVFVLQKHKYKTQAARIHYRGKSLYVDYSFSQMELLTIWHDPRCLDLSVCNNLTPSYKTLSEICEILCIRCTPFIQALTHSYKSRHGIYVYYIQA